MAVINLTVLFDEECRQIALVKESSIEVMRSKPAQGWYTFTGPNGKGVHVHESKKIVIINEVQAEDNTPPQNGKILVAQAQAPSDILKRQN